jgi:hypothetical protein
VNAVFADRNPSAPTLEHLRILAQIAFLANMKKQNVCHILFTKDIENSPSHKATGAISVQFSDSVRKRLHLVRTV